MWIGGGQHFSFANQPQAAGANLRMFLSALEPLLDGDGVSKLHEALLEFDFRNGPLRRKFDGLKYALRRLEDVLYEQSLAGRGGARLR